MKCYYHNDRDAVAQCCECGRGLCKECTDRFDKPLCEKCGNAIITKKQEEIKRAINRQIEADRDNRIRSKEDAKKWLTVCFISMFVFGFLYYSLAREVSTSLSTSTAKVLFVAIGVYMGLAITIATKRSFNPKAAALLAIPLIGWIIFIYVWVFFLVFAIFSAIPDFIALLMTAMKKIDK